MNDPFSPDNVVLPARLRGLSKHNGYYDSEAARERREENRELIKAQYNYEKIIGLRRKNGVRNKKKLTPKDLQIISCFVMGMKPVEIAEQVDFSLQQVHNVLTDPLAREHLDSFNQAHREELGAMLPLVNDAVRDALTSAGIDTRLKGVDRWAKVHRTINGDPGAEKAQQKTEEIHAARFRFVEHIKKLAQEEGVIEAEAVIVEKAEC